MTMVKKYRKNNNSTKEHKHTQVSSSQKRTNKKYKCQYSMQTSEQQRISPFNTTYYRTSHTVVHLRNEHVISKLHANML